MKKTLKQRYIPSDSASREFPEIPAIIYETIKNGVPYAIGYSGKRSKPDFNYRYKNLELREKHIAEYINRLKEIANYKEEQKQKRASFQHTLKVGDILVASWGWEQTNVDFYQVIEVVGKMVKIREIQASMPNGEEGFMTGYVIPVKDKFIDAKIILKKVLQGNTIKIASYAWANLWDGKRCRTSWYG